jgi:hypothetical protein
MADKSRDDWQVFHRELHDRARDRVAALLDGLDAGYLLAKANPTADKLISAVRGAAEEASVRLPRIGGTEKLLTIVPQGAKSELIIETVRHAFPGVNIVPSDEGDLVFCREVDCVSLAYAANDLVADRGDCAAAARRVLTRVDVSWAALETG